MNSLVLVILVPVVSALLAFLFNRLRNEFSFIGAVLTLYFALRIFLTCRTKNISYDLFYLFGTNFSLYADAFAGLFLLVLAFFGLGLVIYSFRYIRSFLPRQQNLYQFYLVATLALANGVILAKNFSPLLLIFLGFLALTSYGMVLLSTTGEKENNAINYIPATTLASSFLLLDVLGIYLLTRISLYWFDLSGNLIARNSLMLLGITIILSFAIIAVRQSNLINRLSFFQISQIGYVILGIGSLSPLGIVGGMFHLLNNLIFSIGLILLAGSIIFRTKNQDLRTLGGLAGKMPFTFGSFLVASIGIAGIPPLGGFFAQWLIFQSLLSLRSVFAHILVACAILGSILTLISFLLVTRSIFLGPNRIKHEQTSSNHIIEVGFSMNLVPMLFALIALTFGILVKAVPLNLFILPSLKPIFPASTLPESVKFFSRSPITVIMIGWVVVGILLFFLLCLLERQIRLRRIDENSKFRIPKSEFRIPNSKCGQQMTVKG
uniref:NADH:quinone oxidoreductase/Mrp antiporter transmembrane domain-containing protein n=1 Tax=candidate division WOR-3 bacterium TaxID=2052148 RepID=A0A7C6A9M0_UNCW3